MSWPGDGAEGFYRNHVGDVKRMLAKYHSGHYKVYNLCSERRYDTSGFEPGAVRQYPFDDHQVPPFGQLMSFVREAQAYLVADKRNVVVVHCKAGKGRTGIAIAALLLHMGRAHSWSAALAQFASQRTNDGKGVTIASQQRWVQYFDYVKSSPSGLPRQRAITLRSVTVSNVPSSVRRRLLIIVTSRSDPPADSEATGDCLAHVAADCMLSARLPVLPRSSGSGTTLGRLLCVAPPKTHGGARLALEDGARGERRTHSAFGSGPLAADATHRPPEPAKHSFCHVGDGWQLLDDSSDRLHLTLSETRGAPTWCIQGAFRIAVYLDSPTRANCLFWTWQHASFLSGDSCTLSRTQLDKVSKRTPKDVCLSLSWTMDDGGGAAPGPTPSATACRQDLARDGPFSEPEAHVPFITADVTGQPRLERVGRGADAVSSASFTRALTDPCALPSAAAMLLDPHVAAADKGSRTSLASHGGPAKPSELELQLLQQLDQAWMGSGASKQVQTPTPRNPFTKHASLYHKTSAFKPAAPRGPRPEPLELPATPSLARSIDDDSSASAIEAGACSDDLGHRACSGARASASTPASHAAPAYTPAGGARAAHDSVSTLTSVVNGRTSVHGCSTPVSPYSSVYNPPPSASALYGTSPPQRTPSVRVRSHDGALHALDGGVSPPPVRGNDAWQGTGAMVHAMRSSCEPVRQDNSAFHVNARRGRLGWPFGVRRTGLPPPALRRAGQNPFGTALPGVLSNARSMDDISDMDAVSTLLSAAAARSTPPDAMHSSLSVYEQLRDQSAFEVALPPPAVARAPRSRLPARA